MSAILSRPKCVYETAYKMASMCWYKEVPYFLHVYHSSQFMITDRNLVIHSLVKNRILITTYIHSFKRGLITQPCPKFDGRSTKLPLGQRWVYFAVLFTCIITIVPQRQSLWINHPNIQTTTSTIYMPHRINCEESPCLSSDLFQISTEPIRLWYEWLYVSLSPSLVNRDSIMHLFFYGTISPLQDKLASGIAMIYWMECAINKHTRRYCIRLKQHALV